MPTSHAVRPEATRPASLSVLAPSDTFAHRHIGPSEAEIAEMLGELGYANLDAFSDAVVPAGIRLSRSLNLAGIPDSPRGEHEVLNALKAIASQNKVMKSFIGMGYYDTITPPVILRNIMENPGWYTQYTPYQAEIAQGRLEALLNFQTMVSDLTALPLAGASLLDEATAAAEAIGMCDSIHEHTRRRYFVASDCHPQTIGVVRTRAEALGIEIIVGDIDSLPDNSLTNLGGVLVQNPATDGSIRDFSNLAKKVHGAGGLVVMATDLLACTLMTPPGEMGADVAVGSAQRFGVPMGFGGPHAAFIATKNEYSRKMPGRIIGVSRDSHGNTAYRMAIQTREQHIKREKATSNICTAQALLAIMAGMYAVYHGPEGLRRIALRVRTCAQVLRAGLTKLGYQCSGAEAFDTIHIKTDRAIGQRVLHAAAIAGMNLRDFGDGTLGISCDETTTPTDLAAILKLFTPASAQSPTIESLVAATASDFAGPLARASGYLTHPVFNTHHSEHEMLRYIFKLMGRDLSLAHSMIPLGSCTMKLNATSEMIPVTWPEFGRMHPFAPIDQTQGYQKLFADLESWLAEITGFAAVSLQPNSGAQGEYAGLLAIRAYHESRGQAHRNVCLIPSSAHGTNPASAVIAGYKVVEVECDEKGNIDVADLKSKAAAHAGDLAALMVTYPSTHGVFEESIKDICAIVHQHGGQVYMDGANMNAQVGLTSPGLIGADVCHLNLHKTFCIPHGGGGPGMGPICVAAHLAPFLAGHPVRSPWERHSALGIRHSTEHQNGKATNAESRMPNAGVPGSANRGPVAAAPFGSPSILTISWMYIAMMGAAGLRRATQVAMLNANYMAKKLAGHYQVLFAAANGRNAHEFILECRPFEKAAGIKVDDIAKRLQDYGFHAPTMSFPVPGTLMIEPTESEPKAELDRFIEAMIRIRAEIRAIEKGEADRADNPLKHAPHTIAAVAADEWKHTYSREQAAFPAPWLRDAKFWPHVGRIDNPYGDRNLICTCPSVAEAAGA